ncbi:amino acid adenylation domain-containing protein [Zhouia spongiae]|uniref:Amino acid adenylation domain-containing protein n=1 Tax=Zhouia spongiae TaxID=2202721 RepID=A0ABY3YL27_9FLAO|nr:non-ribosomal peptide synthetase [Zhouia spongiae]UNY98308.1 amino acid adenylation domain-containing protein [Zhouia spongiae]
MINTISNLIEKYNNQGIKFIVKNDKLSIKTNRDSVPEEVLLEIKKYKTQIISFFKKKYRILSYAQERLWFMDQYNHNSSYNMAGAIRLSGELNKEVLEKVLFTIVNRHEILRTNFVTINDEPKQVIHEVPTCHVEIINLSHLSKEESNKQILDLLKEESQKTFDLANDSLIRFKIYSVDKDESVLFINKHHIISDGWSLSILINEITQLYEAFISGRPSPLKELPIQYGDYSIWQREYLEGELLQKQSKYWKGKLEGVSILELPTDKPRPKEQTFNGDRLPIHLNKDVTDKLNRLSRENDATLFMTLLSIFKILLHKYTGESDICVGSPIANRTRKELEPLLGFFANILALRTSLDDQMTFVDLLRQVKQTTLEAYENQDLPFEKVVDMLEPERNLSYSPLFQVMMVLQNNPEGELKFSGLNVESVGIESTISKFEITLDFTETEKGLYGGIEYNTDLFDSDTIERMANHFKVLVEQLIENSQRQIKDIELLTSSERQQLLFDWNDTQVDYPKEKCIHQLFEEQSEKTPDNVAVVFEGDSLTYRELNERSNQLAYYLQSKGVKAESLVGICVERSLEMIVGLLGILKAGGAYVPIDPTYPEERISYMFKDTNCAIVLTQEQIELPKTNSEIIYLDSKWEKIAKAPRTNIETGVKGDNLAYVIYTSGSTGKPKGVMNQHDGLVNRLNWAQEVYKLQKSDVVLQKTTYCFDVSVWELFWPIIVGSKLVIAKPNGHKDTQYLIEIIRKESITTLHFVPSLLQVMIDTPEFSQCKSLKNILCSGEVLPLELVKKFHRNFDIPLHNLYGPTEAAIDVSSYVCEKVVNHRNIPIGRPVANTQLYILDQYLKPIPVGIPGELCIAGIQVARGYLNQPDLTRKKFIKDPFSKDPNSRLYKTGDLARYLPDGNIEFIGRLDDQVKIRGFRIELGEIESVLNQQDQVSSSVVLAKEDATGNKQLVGYVVPSQDVEPSQGLKIDNLRDALSKTLPDYMVPSLFVSLEAIPLTSNGKIDKKALPDLQGNLQMTKEYVAPKTEIEFKLVSIWQGLLGVEKIGVHDDFFELGGHSLQATRIISKIRTEFNNELPLKVMFESRTVFELSRQIVANKNHGQQINPRVLNKWQGQIPLSYAQERLWFMDQYNHNSSYNMPGAIRFLGELNKEVLEKVLFTIVNRHEILRTNFVTINDEPKQVIHEVPTCHVEIINLSHLSKEESNKQILDLLKEESQKTFDLANDSLIRFKIYSVDKDESVLFINKHHIISDGWSLSILINEITQLYEAFISGRPSPLKELPIQYGDYSIWQREYLEGELLQKQSKYWKGKLEGVSILELPTDKPRPKEQTFNGDRLPIHLNKDVTDKLNRLSRENDATLFMTLLSIFKILLHKYTGESDICVGSPIANRTREEVEGLIGLFVNTLALRSDVNTELSFNEFLGRVKQTTLEAYENQDLPFEKVVDMLEPERNLSYSPLFQVMMVLQNNPEGELKFSGLNVESVGIESTISKFEITLDFTETEKGLYGGIEYNTDLFDSDTIERMANHFKVLVEQLIENSQRQIKDIELLTSSERQQLLFDWNDTQVDYPKEKCIHQLFEEQSEKTPDNVAVVFEGDSLTYRELNERSNQLAYYLQSKGVKAESLVGICVERSLEMIVGLLGILKAGGAYVPIDPTYPEERISYMFKDTNCAIVLTQEQIELPKTNSEIIYLDSEWEKIAKAPRTNIETGVKGDNLAYVIYTSGSTGKPKGVMVEHKSVLRLVKNNKSINLKTTTVLLSTGAVSFDATIFEYWGTLLNGGQLLLCPEAKLMDIESLRKLISRRAVNTMWLTSGLLNSYIDTEINLFSELSFVIVGGEKLSKYHIEKLNGEYPDLIIYNGYGPTENTTFSTNHKIIDKDFTKSSIPIGRPISNSMAYILNKNNRLQSVGIVGEICLGGDGLARGYWKNKLLTSEKFIINPYREGERLYKTGDLGRWLPDGTIEFIGRKDNQVKIRGYRVELDEIEFTLQRIKGIVNCCVVFKEIKIGEKNLIAYYVGDTVEVSDLIEYLRSVLPEHMIPVYFVLLKALPLSQNGKVDRNSLPDPDDISNLLGNDYVAPSNSIEEKLVIIWSDVLGISKENIGINSNFFALGGNSFKIIKLMNKINKAFQYELNVVTLFKYPTIASFSKSINSNNSMNQMDSLLDDATRVFQENISLLNNN